MDRNVQLLINEGVIPLLSTTSQLESQVIFLCDFKSQRKLIQHHETRHHTTTRKLPTTKNAASTGMNV